jgi:hypothetical protein
MSKVTQVMKVMWAGDRARAFSVRCSGFITSITSVTFITSIALT